MKSKTLKIVLLVIIVLIILTLALNIEEIITGFKAGWKES